MPVAQSERLDALPPYLFADITRRKLAALQAGREVIDFGVGDPDEPPPPFIRDAMNQALRQTRCHRYDLAGGWPSLRQEIARFFNRRYGVDLDPQAEVLVLIGSKEGIAHLPQAVVNPGQAVLVPVPGYPAYRAGTIFAGAEPITLDLSAAHGWRIDLDGIAPGVARQAALMYLNYPNNPTAATADLAYFERAVAFAHEHDLLLASDAAYNEVYFDDSPPPSVLQVPGARDVAVEFHSASKTFNMTGWRIGFVVGNADAIAALRRVKANYDSGAFPAIQEAACAAYAQYDHPDVVAARQLYRPRAELLCSGLQALGFKAEPPRATFYVWARVPDGCESLTVCTRLLEEADIVGVPGAGFGPSAEGYVRFSLCVPDERIRMAVERMRGLQW